MKKINFKYLLLILTMHFLFIQSVFSEIILDASDTSISMGDTTVLSLVLKNEKTKDFSIEGIENFEILSRGQRKSTQIVNGKMSSSIAYQYTILPKSTGSFDLKAVSKTTSSNNLRIDVSKTDSNNLNNVGKDFSIKSNMNKDTYYFGEKIVLDEHLITTVNLKNFGFTEPTSFKDFSQKDLTDKNFDAKYTRVNGKKAIDYTVYKGILEPLTSGRFTIPSRAFQVNLSEGDSFFSNTVSKFLQTQEKQLTVLELPPNKPKNFSGAVGELKIEPGYDKNSVSLGEAITLDVKIKGSGNTDPIEKIVASNIPNFKIYENIKNLNESILNNNYYSEKEFEVVFIPQNSGKMKIPEIKIPYFNTKTKNYDFLVIPETAVTVKNDGSADGNNSNSTVISNESSTDSFSDNKTSGNSYITISQIEPESNDKYDKVFNRRYFIILSAIALLSLTFNVVGVLIPAINKSKTKKTSADRKKLIKALKRENDLDKIFLYFNEGLKLKYGINIKSMSSSQIYSYFENYGFKTLEDSNSTENSTVEKIISIKKELEAFKFLNKTSDMLNVNELIRDITKILS